MPDGLPIVQIGLNDWEMGKNYPTELAIGSDVRETLKALTPVLKEKGGSALADAAEKRLAALADKNWTANRGKLIGSISDAGSGTPIDPDWLMLKITEALPENAIVVNEGVTATRMNTHARTHRGMRNAQRNLWQTCKKRARFGEFTGFGNCQSTPKRLPS